MMTVLAMAMVTQASRWVADQSVPTGWVPAANETV